MFIVDILHTGTEAQAGLSDQTLLSVLFTAEIFLIDQQGESFNKGQGLIGGDLLDLTVQGSGHAGEFELAQSCRGL